MSIRRVSLLAVVVIFFLPSAAWACGPFMGPIELFILSLLFALVPAAFAWALATLFVKNPSFNGIYICSFLGIFVFMLSLLSAPSVCSRSIPSNMVSNLRTLQSASIMLRADKGELIRELPRGVNVLELLTQYTANPKSSAWDDYFFIITDNHWWAGLDLNQAHGGRSANVRSRLVSRASTVGLFGTFGAEPPPSNDEAYLYTTSDNFVWLYLKDLREDTTASYKERD